MISETPTTIAVPDGTSLEGRLAPGTSGAGIVVCHPHPLYGGDMDNPVVVRVTEVAGALGLATLRFNFRGVGRSTGRHDEGHAEQHDVVAAIGHVRAELGLADAPVVLAGYSFGAIMAARVVTSQHVGGLSLVAPPLGMSGFDSLTDLAAVGVPVQIVVGTNDQYCPVSALDRARSLLPDAAISIIDGADHFFLGKLFPLGERIRQWLETLELRQARRRGGTG